MTRNVVQRLAVVRLRECMVPGPPGWNRGTLKKDQSQIKKAAPEPQIEFSVRTRQELRR